MAAIDTGFRPHKEEGQQAGKQKKGSDKKMATAVRVKKCSFAHLQLLEKESIVMRYFNTSGPNFPYRHYTLMRGTI